MCSIAGIISKKAPFNTGHNAELGHLLDQMHHRGPDAHHARQCSATAALGSNRLRITDAHNPNADMPFCSSDGRYTIIFNGEIYNHQNLRTEIGNYPFRTNSDTETLLAAYQRWGKDCLEKLEGMFAFCIHDSLTDEIFMACDPTGQKSIYIYEDDESLVFASEIAPLISNPYRSKSWDMDGLAEFIAHRFIVGDNTHIKEIRKLSPGSFLTIKNGCSEQKRYYQIPVGDQNRHDIEAVKSDIRQAVESGCRETFNLEVPHGLLLSGGIDSTAVLAMAAQSGIDMATYSVGFKPTDEKISGSQSVFDEFEHSRSLAALYGTDHHEITLSDVDYCEYLDKWIAYSGEPLGSQEAPCLIKLFEEAGRDARVIFTGSGPDELFDGYSYGEQIKHTPLHALPETYFNRFHWCGDVDLKQLMPGQAVAANTATKYRGFLAPYGSDVKDTLQAVQLLHFHGRLAAYEFRQMDVISMRHSIEARSPLIDKRLIEAAFHFDPALKQMNDDEKGIYKQALRGLVPDSIIDRKKQGFPIPAEMWFSQPFEERAQILFEPNALLTTTGLVDRAYLKQIWNQRDTDHRNIFSRLYTLEKIMRGQSPDLNPRQNAKPASALILPGLKPS